MFSFVVHKFWCLENNTAKYEWRILGDDLDTDARFNGGVAGCRINKHRMPLNYDIYISEEWWRGIVIRKDRPVQMHMKTVFVNKISPPPKKKIHAI